MYNYMSVLYVYMCVCKIVFVSVCVCVHESIWVYVCMCMRMRDEEKKRYIVCPLHHFVCLCIKKITIAFLVLKDCLTYGLD